MRWEDETYVKLYVRDTLTWKSWSWQARTVFMHLLRKVDGAGIVHCEGFDPTDAAALILDLPREVAEPGISQLARSRTIEIGPGVIVLVKFVEAQEARKTDKLRKKDQRQRDRDKARTSQPSENTEGASHEVTRSHTASHDVTRGHSSASASSSTSSPSSSSASTSTSKSEPDALLSVVEDVRPSQMLDAWNEAASGRIPKARTTPQRQKAFQGWLKSHSLEEWRQLVARVNASPFLRGERGDFRATLDWILKPANLAKTLDGNYDDEQESRLTALAAPPCDEEGCSRAASRDFEDGPTSAAYCEEHYYHRYRLWLESGQAGVSA